MSPGYCRRCKLGQIKCICGEPAFELGRIFGAHQIVIDQAASGGLAGLEDAAEEVLITIDDARAQVAARRQSRRAS
jgi:hypothetical protein